MAGRDLQDALANGVGEIAVLELLESRQQVVPLKRAVEEHEATIKSKDEKIAELEAELQKRRPYSDVVLCNACGRSADEEPEPEPEPEPPLVKEDILKKLEELAKQLRASQSELTTAELKRSLAELQLLTHTSKLRRQYERDLEGAQNSAKAALAKAAKEVDSAKAAKRVAENEAAAQQVEVAELKRNLRDRDEQIEFLMQVHDASQSCEWVDTTTASTANDAQVAASMAAAMSLGLDRAGGSSQGSSSPGSMSLGQGAPRVRRNTGPWQCGMCTLKNEGARTLCEACGSERPTS